MLTSILCKQCSKDKCDVVSLCSVCRQHVYELRKQMWHAREQAREQQRFRLDLQWEMYDAKQKEKQ